MTHRKGCEHGIFRWVCRCMVAQLVRAPKAMLLLWRPKLHMGLRVVWGDPKDQEPAVPNVGARQSAMLGV